MKTKFIVATALFGITALAGTGLVYADEEASENEQKIAITEMPIAVQKTIQDNLAGGTVTETAKETKEGPTTKQKSRSPEAKRSRLRSIQTVSSSAPEKSRKMAKKTRKTTTRKEPLR